MMGCKVCGYDEVPERLIDAGQNGRFCVLCAGKAIKELSRQRYVLAAALGYSTGDNALVPIHKNLIKEVKALVDMRNRLRSARDFLLKEV